MQLFEKPGKDFIKNRLCISKLSNNWSGSNFKICTKELDEQYCPLKPIQNLDLYHEFDWQKQTMHKYNPSAVTNKSYSKSCDKENHRISDYQNFKEMVPRGNNLKFHNNPQSWFLIK